MEPQQSFKDKMKDFKYVLKLTLGLYVVTFAAMMLGNRLVSGRANSLIFTNLIFALVLVCIAATIWLAFLLVKYLTERI